MNPPQENFKSYQVEDVSLAEDNYQYCERSLEFQSNLEIIYSGDDVITPHSDFHFFERRIRHCHI